MDDRTLIEQFERCTLPFERWTHRTHVKVAYVYLTTYPLDEAIDRVRRGIKAYNAANDVPEGPLMGYNETTTQALMRLIDVTIRAYAETHPVHDADSFCDMHPQLMSKHILRLFYTPGRRIEPEAWTRYLEPDMAPMPVVPARV